MAAPALAQRPAPPEAWERVKDGFGAWLRRHPGLVRVLRRIGQITQIATLILFLIAMLVIPDSLRASRQPCGSSSTC